MDIEDARDLSNEASRHWIKHQIERVALEGEEFEYKLNFGPKLVFKKGKAARKFIEALISEHNLVEGQMHYRVAFGWEI